LNLSAAAGVAGVQLPLPVAVASTGTWGGGSTGSSMPTTPKVHAALREAAQPAAAAAAAGVGLAPAAAACARASVTSALTSCASSSAVAASGALLSTAAVSSDSDVTAAAAVVGGTLRRHGRQRQKHVHVAGSGVYSPATMAALQHVSSLQAQSSANKNSWSGQSAVVQGGNAADAGRSASTTSADRASAALTGRCSSSRPGSPRQGGGGSSSSRPASAVTTTRASARCSSILAGPTAGTAGTAAAAASAGVDGVMCRGSSLPRGPAAAAASAGKSGCSGAVTAAERYWAQPGHASSGAAAGLSPLLSSLFTGEACVVPLAGVSRDA
jgi:hypothetical protein